MESILPFPSLLHVDTTMPHCTASEPSPNIGRGHHRQLSSSAKWASNQVLALEYLKRQRDILIWIEKVLNRKMPSRDLYEVLKSGVILRELLEKLHPEPASVLSPISRKYTPRMAPWKERENISVFLKQCKALGMSDFSLFCTDDLYEGTNMVQVLFGLQTFASFAQERYLQLATYIHTEEKVDTNVQQPLDQQQENEAEFSHQEVENAMSKISAGGNTATLQSLLGQTVAPADTTTPVTTKDFSFDQIVATLSLELEAASSTSTSPPKGENTPPHDMSPSEESCSTSSPETQSTDSTTIQVQKEVASVESYPCVSKRNETREGTVSDSSTCIISGDSNQNLLKEELHTVTDIETEVDTSEQDTSINTSTQKNLVALSKKLQSELVDDEALSARDVSSCACGTKRCSIM